MTGPETETDVDAAGQEVKATQSSDSSELIKFTLHLSISTVRVYSKLVSFPLSLALGSIWGGKGRGEERVEPIW